LSLHSFHLFSRLHSPETGLNFGDRVDFTVVETFQFRQFFGVLGPIGIFNFLNLFNFNKLCFILFLQLFNLFPGLHSSEA